MRVLSPFPVSETGIIGLINPVYNMCRYEQIVRLNLLPVKC